MKKNKLNYKSPQISENRGSHLQSIGLFEKEKPLNQTSNADGIGIFGVNPPQQFIT